MKVLLAHNQFNQVGGAEVFYHEVGRIIEEHGHEVAFFSAAEEGVDSSWGEYFPSVFRYDSRRLFSKFINIRKFIYNRNAKVAMTRLIQDFKPDIIHAFAVYVKLTPAILDAARNAGVPVVMSCNDYKHICPNYKLYHNGHICEECNGGRFYRATVNCCCHDSLAYSLASTLEAYAHSWMNIYRKNVHTFLFASEFMARKTTEFWVANSFRWRMLRNPFNTPKHLLNGKVGDYALFFGRLIDEKGVAVLLNAASMVPELPLVVIGDGPDREKLEKQAMSVGFSNVRFVGPKWGKELNDLLRDCRFVVVPSLWYENFPYVILQAFAAGKPVIGSNRGGIPELVIHGRHGLIYESTDAQALASAMQTLADHDDQFVMQMGEMAKNFVKTEFNDNVFYRHLMEIYREVLA
jgi:glycosyltransferase involved in cell wall biosynthesis